MTLWKLQSYVIWTEFYMIAPYIFMQVSNTSMALKGNDSKCFLHCFWSFSILSPPNSSAVIAADWLCGTGKTFVTCDGQFVGCVLQHVPLSSSFLFLAAVCRSSRIHSHLCVIIFAVLLLRQCWSSFRNIYILLPKHHRNSVLVQQL